MGRSTQPYGASGPSWSPSAPNSAPRTIPAHRGSVGLAHRAEVTLGARSHVVSFNGELDIWKEDEVEKRLAAVNGEQPLVIDLSDVRYIDSAFVSALVRLRRRLPHAEITIVAPTPSVRRIFELTDMQRVFTIVDRPAQ